MSFLCESLCRKADSEHGTKRRWKQSTLFCLFFSLSFSLTPAATPCCKVRVDCDDGPQCRHRELELHTVSSLCGVEDGKHHCNCCRRIILRGSRRNGCGVPSSLYISRLLSSSLLFSVQSLSLSFLRSPALFYSDLLLLLFYFTVSYIFMRIHTVSLCAVLIQR